MKYRVVFTGYGQVPVRVDRIERHEFDMALTYAISRVRRVPEAHGFYVQAVHETHPPSEELAAQVRPDGPETSRGGLIGQAAQ